MTQAASDENPHHREDALIDRHQLVMRALPAMWPWLNTTMQSAARMVDGRAALGLMRATA